MIAPLHFTIKNYDVTIAQNPDVAVWEDDIAIKYHAYVTTKQKTSIYTFYVPHESALSISRNDASLGMMILEKVKQIIEEELFDHPHYQEYVFQTNGFENIITSIH